MTAPHKPPVILQVLPSLRSGGVERGTVEVAEAIAQAEGVALVASSGGGMLPMIAYVGGKHITLPLDTKNPFHMLGNIEKLVRVISEYKVDIVHARSRAPAWSAYYAAKRTGRRFITTFHGVYGLQNKYKRKYNSIMVRGERVIAISNFIAEHISREYAVDEEKIRIIYRGVDLKKFNPSAVASQRLEKLATEWRLPEHLPVIIMPARITRWKGHEVAIKALAKLPHRNFICLLIGDDIGHTSYRQELEELIVNSNLGGHVRFVSNTPYMPEAYMLADCVLAPSIEPEAFGRVPVEAQAMGKLVIAADHGGARETVVHGETGWLIPPGNADELMQAIQDCLTIDPGQKNWMSENAMIHVRKNFSSQLMCKKTLDVYEELLK